MCVLTRQASHNVLVMRQVSHNACSHEAGVTHYMCVLRRQASHTVLVMRQVSHSVCSDERQASHITLTPAFGTFPLISAMLSYYWWSDLTI